MCLISISIALWDGVLKSDMHALKAIDEAAMYAEEMLQLQSALYFSNVFILYNKSYP